MVLFLQLLILAIGSLVICYFIGTALLQLLGVALSEELFFGTFLRLLSGLTVLAAGYAVFRTRGNTILLPVLVLMLVMLYLMRRSTSDVEIPAVINWRTPAMFMGMSAVVFLVQYLLLYEPGSPFLQTPFQDNIYYSRLTLPLNKFGVETKSLEAIFPQFQTVQPYHYFEAWLNALLVRLTGLTSVWVFFVSVATVLFTTCVVGFAAVYVHCGVRVRWAALLGLLTLTVEGTVWQPLMRMPLVANSSLLMHLSFALVPKLAPIYLFELLAGLLLLRGRLLAAGCALAILPLLSVSTAPAVACGVFGLAIYLWLCHFEAAPLRKSLMLVAPTLLGLAYMGGFYALQHQAYQFPVSNSVSGLAIFIPAASDAKTLLFISIGVVLMYGVYYVGYGVLVGLLALRRNGPFVLQSDRPILVWIAATVVGAVLMRTIGHRFLDGFQFFSNPIIPLTAILVAMLLGRVLQGADYRSHLLATGAVLVLGWVGVWNETAGNTRFSAQFLQQVGPILRSLPNRGGFLLADADYKNAYMMSADSYTAGTYVSNFKNDYLLLSLSALVPDSLSTDARYARDSTQAVQIQRNTTLYRLAKLRSLEHRPVAAEEAPLELVRRAKLAFICAAPRAVLPPSLRPLVLANYHDSFSGESFYVLKPSD